MARDLILLHFHEISVQTIIVLGNKKISNNVISYNFISERLVSAGLRSSLRRDSRYLTVVCCYAPTPQRSLSNSNLADFFYFQLEHNELVLGDLNAKVGSSSPDSSSVVGGFPNTYTTMPMMNAL